MAGTDWIPVLEDEFDREMIGPDWQVLRGDWRIEEGSLRVTRAWPSDNNLLCRKVMPRGDMRAVVKFSLEPDCWLHLALRTGEYLWGGGGFNDSFSANMACTKEYTKVKLDGRSIHIPPDKDCTLEITIENGKGIITVNGQKLIEETVPPARSEFNRGFYMNCLPNGWIRSVKLYTKTGQTSALPLTPNSAKENKQATVFAEKYIDPKNPALGMQKAIDSLPPNGGAVVLPAGEFIMRRHLALPSGVTLRGQGYDKTILRACPFHVAKVEQAEEKEDHCIVTLDDASAFKVGDGICYGGAWGHPGMPKNPNIDHVITAINGNVVTVNGRKPKRSTSLSHFFPLIFSVAQEFVGVKDVTLTWTPPPKKEPEIDPKTGKPKPVPRGIAGGFLTCPVTFGALKGGRIARVNINGYPSDGVSLQVGADALVTDNTVTGTSSGFHPGSRTQRFLWGRNSSVGNTLGIFFCFSNENGIYYRGTMAGFGGYPAVGDVFNAFIGNDMTQGVGIGGGGYAGLFFNNRIPSLGTSDMPSEPGLPIYFSAPHYYVLAENQFGKLTLGEGTETVLIAGNTGLEKGTSLEVVGNTKPNLYAARGLDLARKLNMQVGAGRDKPVPAISLPDPILDGRRHYNGRKPDCGFQRALDKLAKKGGTLQLPGGRYALGMALNVPAGVTLTGHGVGTVLYAADGYDGSLIVSEGTKNVSIRDLTILSRYDPAVKRAAAIRLHQGQDAQIVGIDIRGWEGAGVEAVNSSVVIKDCRAFNCAGDACRCSDTEVQVYTSLARSCARGFVVNGGGGRSVIEGVIASGNAGGGVVLMGVVEPLVHGCNLAFNGEDGVLLKDVTGGHVVANLCRANNMKLGDGGGVRLAGVTTKCTVSYNFCSGDQIHTPQAHGIVEEKSAGKNTISFNLACPFYMNHQPKRLPPVLAQGTGSTVEDNLIRNASPSGSSIESRVLGWFGTPHAHNMKRGSFEQQKKQYAGQLKYAKSGAESYRTAIAETKKKLAEHKGQAEPAAKQVKAMEAKLQAQEQSLAKTEKVVQTRELMFKKAILELDIMDQEKKIRYSKFAIIELRNQDADAKKIKAAEAVLAKDEKDLLAKQEALQKLM